MPRREAKDEEEEKDAAEDGQPSAATKRAEKAGRWEDLHQEVIDKDKKKDE